MNGHAIEAVLERGRHVIAAVGSLDVARIKVVAEILQIEAHEADVKVVALIGGVRVVVGHSLVEQGLPEGCHVSVVFVVVVVVHINRIGGELLFQVWIQFWIELSAIRGESRC